MSENGPTDSGEHASWIIVWFILDAIVALAPPLHWAVDGLRGSLFGIPVVLLYFVGVAVFITASIIAAYAAETCSGEIG